MGPLSNAFTLWLGNVNFCMIGSHLHLRAHYLAPSSHCCNWPFFTLLQHNLQQCSDESQRRPCRLKSAETRVSTASAEKAAERPLARPAGIRPADIFLYVFLPPLLLDSAVRMDYFVFKKVRWKTRFHLRV